MGGEARIAVLKRLICQGRQKPVRQKEIEMEQVTQFTNATQFYKFYFMILMTKKQ